MLTVEDGSLITTTEGERCEAAVSNFWRDYQGKEIGGPPDPHYPKVTGVYRTILSVESSVMDSGDWAIVVGLGPPFPYFDERTFHPIPEEYEGFPMYFKPHF